MLCTKYLEDGYVSAENIENYKQVTKAGAGLTIQEANYVSEYLKAVQ